MIHHSSGSRHRILTHSGTQWSPTRALLKHSNYSLPPHNSEASIGPEEVTTNHYLKRRPALKPGSKIKIMFYFSPAHYDSYDPPGMSGSNISKKREEADIKNCLD